MNRRSYFHHYHHHHRRHQFPINLFFLFINFDCQTTNNVVTNNFTLNNSFCLHRLFSIGIYHFFIFFFVIYTHPSLALHIFIRSITFHTFLRFRLYLLPFPLLYLPRMIIIFQGIEEHKWVIDIVNSHSTLQFN